MCERDSKHLLAQHVQALRRKEKFNLENIETAVNRRKHERFAILIIVLQEIFKDFDSSTTDEAKTLTHLKEIIVSHIKTKLATNEDLQEMAIKLIPLFRKRDTIKFLKKFKQTRNSREASTRTLVGMLGSTLYLAICDLEVLVETFDGIFSKNFPEIEKEVKEKIFIKNYPLVHWFVMLHGKHEPLVKERLRQGNSNYNPLYFHYLSATNTFHFKTDIVPTLKTTTDTLGCPAARLGIIKLLWRKVIEIKKASG